jgi:hypothetical protein
LYGIKCHPIFHHNHVGVECFIDDKWVVIN